MRQRKLQTIKGKENNSLVSTAGRYSYFWKTQVPLGGRLHWYPGLKTRCIKV